MASPALAGQANANRSVSHYYSDAFDLLVIYD
jgi:hypothetical protein